MKHGRIYLLENSTPNLVGKIYNWLRETYPDQYLELGGFYHYIHFNSYLRKITGYGMGSEPEKTLNVTVRNYVESQSCNFVLLKFEDEDHALCAGLANSVSMLEIVPEIPIRFFYTNYEP